jgi:hypothetical protein
LSRWARKVWRMAYLRGRMDDLVGSGEVDDRQQLAIFHHGHLPVELHQMHVIAPDGVLLGG